MSGLLLVAAIERELCEVDGSVGVCCGVGPVEAALATANALAQSSPRAVLNVGTAGAHNLPRGTLVIGSKSVYCDVLDPHATAPRVAHLPADPGLLHELVRALPHAVIAPIATTGRVGGGVGCDVEAMEGFGVLRAASAANVAAVELRVICNSPAELDRRLWHVDHAFEVLHDAIRAAVPSLLDHPA